MGVASYSVVRVTRSGQRACVVGRLALLHWRCWSDRSVPGMDVSPSLANGRLLSALGRASALLGRCPVHSLCVQPGTLIGTYLWVRFCSYSRFSPAQQEPAQHELNSSSARWYCLMGVVRFHPVHPGESDLRCGGGWWNTTNTKRGAHHRQPMAIPIRTYQGKLLAATSP